MVNNKPYLTKEQIAEELEKIGFKESITDHGNGWYTVDAPGMTIGTNKAGIDLINKAMREEFKKLNNDRTE